MTLRLYDVAVVKLSCSIGQTADTHESVWLCQITVNQFSPVETDLYPTSSSLFCKCTCGSELQLYRVGSEQKCSSCKRIVKYKNYVKCEHMRRGGRLVELFSLQLCGRPSIKRARRHSLC